MKITAVYLNPARQTATLEASEGDTRLCCDFCPRDLQSHVRAMLGPPPPPTPSVADMEWAINRATASRAEDPWVDPRVEYRRTGIAIIAKLVSYQMRRIEIPDEAAEALLDFKEWRAS